MRLCPICRKRIFGKYQYCSEKCKNTKIKNGTDTQKQIILSGYSIEKKERKCKKCNKKYNNHNPAQCPDCWRKYTKGDEIGSEIADLSGLYSGSYKDD